MMNQKRLLCGVVGALLASSFTGVVFAESMKDAVDKALKSNPDVLASVAQRQARDKEKRGAEAGYYPKLDLIAGVGREYTSNPGVRAATDPDGKGVTLTRSEFGLIGRQMVYDGGLTPSEVARQQARVNSAAYEVLGTTEQTALDAVQSYLAVSRNRTVLKLSEDNLKSHQRIEDQIGLRSKSGVGRRADLDQVKARVALARSNIVAARVNLSDAEATYQKIVGELPGDSEEVTSWGDKMPATLEVGLDDAMIHNPVLKSANADIEATNAQYEAAKAPMRPRLDVEGEANANGNIDGVRGYANDWQLMLRLRYNIYRGGEDEARLEERAFNINEAKEVRNKTMRQLEEAVRLAWSAYESTQIQVEHLSAQVEYNRLTRDAYSKQFNIGQRTLLDLLNTENELFDAQIELTRAESDKLFAERRIMAAIGKLVEAFGLESPAAGQVATAM